MKNFSTWMLLMFVIMFWILRIAVAISAETGDSFAGIEPFNQTLEIILLFVVLACVILIVKRKMIGALIYLLAYGMYFGGSLMTNITTLIGSSSNISMANSGMYLGAFVSLVGVILPIAVLLDLLFDKGRKANPKDKKTDWFYNNEQYDRKMDDRADKNNYRTL